MLNISFLSGTRADYSKIKPYIEYLIEKKRDVQIYIFVTCMHTLAKYGHTCKEIEKDFGKKCHIVVDKTFREENTAQETAHIVASYDTHLRKDRIDFVFVHGDRPEALAGAIAARLNNIPVCQIEAGDLSGSIDDSIRHAITKLANRFLVCDTAAKGIVRQLGEDAANIFIAGNSSLANKASTPPPLQDYPLPFDKYAILIYHPTTTLSEVNVQKEIQTLMQELKKSKLNYLVIMPNNDLHHQVILDTYQQYKNDPHFCFFKSLPLNVYLTLLKNALFLVGNSSCGIKEAPYYHVPCIDIGLRQKNRCWNIRLKDFYHVDTAKGINTLIRKITAQKHTGKTPAYRKQFFNRLNRAFSDNFWEPDIQKEFCHLPRPRRQRSSAK